MIKTETVRARIAPKLKRSAESVFNAIGLNPSQAIVLFYKQVELHQGLPFEVKLPSYKLENAAKLTDSEYDAKLEPGYRSALAGRTRSVSAAHDDFRRRHAKARAK